jgi:hypothetical protein
VLVITLLMLIPAILLGLLLGMGLYEERTQRSRPQEALTDEPGPEPPGDGDPPVPRLGLDA